MKRHRCTPRVNWQQTVEATGLTYHTHAEGPYWDESACYELEAREVAELEAATSTLHRLCIDAAEEVIKRGWWQRLGIPEIAVPTILASWERDDFSLYGRFDLAYDGRGAPKLLEYNADTPTALVEAAVTQWFWLQDTHPEWDQFNSIHERLIAAWRRWGGQSLYFAGVKDHEEDAQTVLYLRDTCEQAGVKTRTLHIEDMGWDEGARMFVDLAGLPVKEAFKLYPWEWLWAETFGQKLAEAPVQFLEPAWKMLLGNKALLPVLWEMFPEHPNLLASYDEPGRLTGGYVRKPKWSREGANVTLFEGGVAVEETEGMYGEGGYVFQELGPVPNFEGYRPVLGLWVVDHEPAGLGIREDTARITGNLSRFVPHFFRPA
jgi:glutathionylspermidine synthase